MVQSLQGKRVFPTNPFDRFEQTEIEQSISDRFEKQVALYPDRVAVKDGNCQLTYAELNQVANRAARAILAQRGEGEESIALLLGTGASAVVGILAVLKAGKIYVPLDASFPRSRLDYMLEDSQARLVVTNHQNRPFAADLVPADLPLVNVDELDPSLSPTNPDLSVSPDTYACLLYTSGSTGQPKGVVDNHRNLLHGTMVVTNAYHICPDDRISILKSFCFSGSQRNLFPALLNGASLHPFDVKQRRIDELADWLIEEEITVHGSRVTFREFVHTLAGEEAFPKVRLMGFGGGPAYRRDVEICRKIYSPDTVVMVGLATTEAGPITRYFMDRETPISGEVIPVGYAVEGVEVLLLADGQEVGFNQPGEIAVKSRYLSPGYWRRPDLTQAKFRSDPTHAGERIFLTGDIGMMLPDGCLLHLGRKDSQVKIRGYRVEPAETEATLMRHDLVRQAVVMTRENQRDERCLVAYVVPKEQQTLSATGLRRFLLTKLPDYMIPSAFVILDELPRTLSGKVDRRALPAPDWTRPALQAAFVAPRTAVEKSVAEIWSRVLVLEPIGIHDNFFELGGHSLLATRVISRILDTLHVELSPRSLYERPTVAGLAHAILTNEAKPGQTKEIAQVLERVKSLSSEELTRMLWEKRAKRGGV